MLKFAVYPMIRLMFAGSVMLGLNVVVGNPGQTAYPAWLFTTGVDQPLGRVVGTLKVLIFIAYRLAETKNSA